MTDKGGDARRFDRRTGANAGRVLKGFRNAVQPDPMLAAPWRDAGLAFYEQEIVGIASNGCGVVHAFRWEAGDFCDQFGFFQGWLHQTKLGSGPAVLTKGKPRRVECAQ